MPVEDWNAQISLMTGMAAAEIMLRASVGILRTMPEPEGTHAWPGSAEQARALGVHLAGGQPYGEFLRSLDREDPQAAGADPRGGGAVPRRRLHPVRR